MMARSMPMRLEFRADHPFLFHIMDKLSNTVIFSGRGIDLKKE